MAADCKSAAPWSYGGSNPPLCTMIRRQQLDVNDFDVKRLAVALGALAVLLVLTWTTISDEKLRLAGTAVLVLFAVKILVRRQDVLHRDVKGSDEPM